MARHKRSEFRVKVRVRIRGLVLGTLGPWPLGGPSGPEQKICVWLKLVFAPFLGPCSQGLEFLVRAFEHLGGAATSLTILDQT